MSKYKSNDPCVVCGYCQSNSVCFHHLKTRKSGGSDNFYNMISVCQNHHNEFHSKGIYYMADKYITVENWLLKNNWTLDVKYKKWSHGGI